ncbi:ribonuclease III domain-containing protein, partial [Obelidium mucronatum]
MHQSGRSETTSRQEIVYLIPQFCTPYPIPFSLFTETACFMPILIQTLYHRLCTIEIQQSLKLLDYSTPALFQTALTSAGAQCHQDYERLEFLGDSFLKMYLSLHLFTLNPTRDEGWLSRSRVLLERNKNLLKMSIHNKLPNVLLCEPISRKTWLLPTGTPQTQHVSDKSAADLVESIVGACVVSTGVVGGGKAVRVFFGDEFEESLTAYSFRIESIRLKANMLGSSMINQNSNQNHQLLRDQLFKKLGYRFNDNNLAVEALAHVSAIHIYGIPYCFQRLEFLGDSVLGYLIAKMLFCLPELHKPGKLSSLKSELVNNQFLAIVTFKLGLHKLLLHATPGLAHSLAEFGNQISIFKQSKATDTQKPLFWHSLPSAPKVAGDILESIIGAVFLDSGCDVQVTEHLIQRVLVQPWKSHF